MKENLDAIALAAMMASVPTKWGNKKQGNNLMPKKKKRKKRKKK